MVREFEYQVRQRGGAIPLGSPTALRSVRDEAGEVIRYEGTVRDITIRTRRDAIAEAAGAATMTTPCPLSSTSRTAASDMF